MTPPETLEHVLNFSCRRCVNFREGKGSEQRCMAAFDKCKAGKPLTSTPPMFKRRVK